MGAAEISKGIKEVKIETIKNSFINRIIIGVEDIGSNFINQTFGFPRHYSCFIQFQNHLIYIPNFLILSHLISSL